MSITPSFSIQHTILLHTPHRAHIDIIFTDKTGHVTYLELKHFSISQNRGHGRRLSFYTSNSVEGKKIGIVGDCEKLQRLRNEGFINHEANLVCCAITTPRPTQKEKNNMENSFVAYPELIGWNVIYPVPYLQQNPNVGIITLQN